MKKFYFYLCSAAIGVLNGLFGGGGGILAVPLLKKSGLDGRSAHASSLGIILPLCIVSAFLYGKNNAFKLGEVLPLLPLGLIGAVVGSFLLRKISPKLLGRIFGALLIASAIRMLML